MVQLYRIGIKNEVNIKLVNSQNFIREKMGVSLLDRSEERRVD